MSTNSDPMDAKEKRGGLIMSGVCLAVGLACLYLFGYVPWRDGVNHEPEVTLSFKSLMVGAALAIMGALAIFGLLTAPAAEPRPGEPASNSRWGWLYLALLVALCAAPVVYYFWLQAFLRGEGYDV
jgi:hypothetical protein